MSTSLENHNEYNYTELNTLMQLNKLCIYLCSLIYGQNDMQTRIKFKSDKICAFFVAN